MKWNYTIFHLSTQGFYPSQRPWIGDQLFNPQLKGTPILTNNRQRVETFLQPYLWHCELIASGIPVVPREVTISQPKDSLLNTLIKIKDIEYCQSGWNLCRMLGNAKQHLKPCTLATCSSSEIFTLGRVDILDFVGVTVPSGKGTIAAIYSIFGKWSAANDRGDLNDADMNGPRCGSASRWWNPCMSIQDIKHVYKKCSRTHGSKKPKHPGEL